VGDRLDTDITGAHNAGLDSLLVLTGSHGPRELLGAPAGSRPTHLGHDLTALLEPARVAELSPQECRVGSARAALVGDGLEVSGPALDALWAAARLSWQAADQGHPLDPDATLRALPTG
jgi:glycerol 3-phosphatase-2